MKEETDQHDLDQDALNQRIDQAIALVGKQNELLTHLYQKLVLKTGEGPGDEMGESEPSPADCSEGGI